MFHWIQLIPYVFELVKLAEKYLGPGTGMQKKEMVTEGAKVAVDAVSNVSTGGQKDTWGAIGPLVSSVIDFAAGFLFPHEDEE